jgi:hypothetical protein
MQITIIWLDQAEHILQLHASMQLVDSYVKALRRKDLLKVFGRIDS